MAKNKSNTVLRALALAAYLVCFPVSQGLADQIPSPGQVKTALNLEEDKGLLDFVKNSVLEPHKGARNFLQNKQFVEFSPAALYQRAMSDNLTIGYTRENKIITGAALTRNKAVFDPYFNLSVSYFRSRTYERADWITRVRGIAVDPADLENEFNEKFADFEENVASGQVYNGGAKTPCVFIDGIIQNPLECRETTEIRTEEEWASYDGKPVRKWTGSLYLSKSFWWGSSISFGVTTNHHTKYYYGLPATQTIAHDQNGYLNYKDPFLLGDRFRWTSGYSLSLSSPVPYAKGFGENDPFYVSEKQAVIGVEKNDLDSKYLTEQALKNVDASYWELVRALLHLKVASEYRRNLEDIYKRTLRRYEMRLTTEYGKSQVEAAYESSRNQEEIGWNNYLVSSNFLADLLNTAPDSIIIPNSFFEILAENYHIDSAGEVNQKSLVKRSDLQSLYKTLTSSDLQLDLYSNQLKPALVFSASASGNQSDAVMGYPSIGKSMSELFDPDSTTYYAGISYSIPFGNSAVKSRLQQTKISRRQANQTIKRLEHEIAQQSHNEVSNALSVRSRLSLGFINLRLASIAYSKAEKRSERGLVSEFERLEKLNDLLLARQAYLDVLIDNKKAHSSLLAAQGEFTDYYLSLLD
jgi:outer membrane protein TolC